KERRVVIDEIRGRQEDPASVVHERAWSRFFGGPLGHPICGTIRSLHEMTSRAVRRFIARQFVPSNMTLALVGGVTPARLRRALTRVFPASGTRPTPCPRLPPRGARGTVRLRRRDLAQSYLVPLRPPPRRRPRAASAPSRPPSRSWAPIRTHASSRRSASASASATTSARVSSTASTGPWR